MKYLTSLVLFALITVTTPQAFAQNRSTFQIDTMVSDGKKSKEVGSSLSFAAENFTVSSKKTGVYNKTFNFADVQAADYSYSKKPLLSTGGAVAMAILTGLIVLPFLFMKKKSHWLSVRTADEYVVMKLDRENYRQVLAEFEVKQVKITTVDEEEKKKDK